MTAPFQSTREAIERQSRNLEYNALAFKRAGLCSMGARGAACGARQWTRGGVRLIGKVRWWHLCGDCWRLLEMAAREPVTGDTISSDDVRYLIRTARDATELRHAEVAASDFYKVTAPNEYKAARASCAEIFNARIVAAQKAGRTDGANG